jgi:hypothetical protein
VLQSCWLFQLSSANRIFMLLRNNRIQVVFLNSSCFLLSSTASWTFRKAMSAVGFPYIISHIPTLMNTNHYNANVRAWCKIIPCHFHRKYIIACCLRISPVSSHDFTRNKPNWSLAPVVRQPAVRRHMFVHFPLFGWIQRIRPSSRPCIAFCKKYFFFGLKLLAPRLSTNLEDHTCRLSKAAYSVYLHLPAIYRGHFSHQQDCEDAPCCDNKQPKQHVSSYTKQITWMQGRRVCLWTKPNRWWDWKNSESRRDILDVQQTRTLVGRCPCSKCLPPYWRRCASLRHGGARFWLCHSVEYLGLPKCSSLQRPVFATQPTTPQSSWLHSFP